MLGGVVGLKPTYGRVTRFGLISYAASLDVTGCFGSSVSDTGILLHAIAGHDRFDATTSNQVMIVHHAWCKLVNNKTYNVSLPVSNLCPVFFNLARIRITTKMHFHDKLSIFLR